MSRLARVSQNLTTSTLSLLMILFIGCERRSSLIEVSTNEAKQPFRVTIDKMVAGQTSDQIKLGVGAQNSEELELVARECRIIREKAAAAHGGVQKPTSDTVAGGLTEIEIRVYLQQDQSQKSGPLRLFPIPFSNCGIIETSKGSPDSLIQIAVQTKCLSDCSKVAILVHARKAKGKFKKDEAKAFFQTQNALVYRPLDMEFDQFQSLQVSALDDQKTFIEMDTFLELLADLEKSESRATKH